MSEANTTTKPKKFHHLNKFLRGQIEALLKLNLPKTQITRQGGISRSTLYEELKHDTTTQMNSDLTFREEYFAYTGQIVYKKSNDRPILSAVIREGTIFFLKQYAPTHFIITSSWVLPKPKISTWLDSGIRKLIEHSANFQTTKFYSYSTKE